MWLSLIWMKLNSPVGDVLSQSGGIAEAVGPQNASLHDEQGSRAGPGHAVQESTAVNSIVIVIVKNQIFILS